jgi:thiol-disulfide isomerase/thioredoxin
MKKGIGLICISMIGQFMCVCAQTKEWRPLKVGEKVPDLSFKTLNFSKPMVKISDFKGKLLILDFWSTWCSTCLAEFPTIYELQQRFKDSIQILPIGFETFEVGSINKFISSRKGTSREFKLPTAIVKYGDETLNKLFPHSGLPFEIWIDKTGRFIAATDQFALNNAYINKLVNGESIYLPNLTKDVNFDFSIPLLLNGNGGDENNFEFRSVLTRYNPAISLPTITLHDSTCTRLATGSSTVIDFLKFAVIGASGIDTGYNFGRDALNKITILENNNSDLQQAFMARLVNTQSPDSIERFNRDHLYNYDLVLPASFSLQDAYKIMLGEIQQLFKVNAVVETRRINCLTLVQNNADSVLNLKKQSLTGRDYTDRDDFHYQVVDGNINAFCTYLNVFMKNIPVVVNSTGIDYLINMDIFFTKDENVKSLNEKLSKYGLELMRVSQDMEVLVLR